MLRTRIVVGTLLTLGTAGILFGDAYFLSHAPFLLAAVLLLGWSGTRELWRMLPAKDRPAAEVVGWFVPLILASNWLFVIFNDPLDPKFATQWHPVFGTFVVAVVIAFLYEILNYANDGNSSKRVAFAVLLFVYMGLFPSFLVQMRWLPKNIAGPAIAATIFVPKVGDIFALLTGMAVGKHRFTPTLSPKKTWEGFLGGMLAAVGTAVAFRYIVPALFQEDVKRAVVFGLLVGLAGVFGDLAESMFKRDCQIKDASQSIPGFGGVLDVVDSILFAAPVAYFLLKV